MCGSQTSNCRLGVDRINSFLQFGSQQRATGNKQSRIIIIIIINHTIMGCASKSICSPKPHAAKAHMQGETQNPPFLFTRDPVPWEGAYKTREKRSRATRNATQRKEPRVRIDRSLFSSCKDDGKYEISLEPHGPQGCAAVPQRVTFIVGVFNQKRVNPNLYISIVFGCVAVITGIVVVGIRARLSELQTNMA